MTMGWKVRGIRGATTAKENTPEAMREALKELLKELMDENHLEPDNIVSVIFTATPDLNAIFPARIARELPGWDHIPLLDVQQMQVEGEKNLKLCIRVLIQVNTTQTQSEINHIYLRDAKILRPDWS